MRRLLVVLVLAGVTGAVLKKELPSIQRYLKIEKM